MRRTSATSCSKVLTLSATARRTGNAPEAWRMAPRACSTDARKSASLSSCDGSRARASMASPARIGSRSRGASSGKMGLSPRYFTASVVAARAVCTARKSVCGRRAARRVSPSGVNAKLRTASTTRSNSRAFKAPACIRREDALEVRKIEGCSPDSSSSTTELGNLTRPDLLPQPLPGNTRRAYGVDGNRGRESSLRADPSSATDAR